MRASVSSSSALSFEGDQEVTAAGPRMTSGTFWPSATPASRGERAGQLRQRAVQPAALQAHAALGEPFSSTSWPSKCERSR